jgi:hypothetical protein
MFDTLSWAKDLQPLRLIAQTNSLRDNYRPSGARGEKG